MILLCSALGQWRNFKMNADLILNINQSLEIEMAPSTSYEEMREKLAAHINHLINTNFEKLVFYLYRIDVDENKMRKLLDNNKNQDSALLLADLIIERQLQKIESRRKNSANSNVNEEDKW